MNLNLLETKDLADGATVNLWNDKRVVIQGGTIREWEVGDRAEVTLSPEEVRELMLVFRRWLAGQRV